GPGQIEGRARARLLGHHTGRDRAGVAGFDARARELAFVRFATRNDAAVTLGTAVGDVFAAAAFDQVGAAAAVERLVPRGPDDVVVERGPDHRLEIGEPGARFELVDPAAGRCQAVIGEAFAEIDIDTPPVGAAGEAGFFEERALVGEPGSRP